MSELPSYLKVQWRVALDWPDFGFGGRRGATRLDSSGAPLVLDEGTWLRILDDVADACSRLPRAGRMHFYLGPRDRTPRLLWPLFERARARGLELHLLGRPGFLDEPTVAALERLDVSLFNVRFRPLERGPEGDALELAAAERAIGLLRRSRIPFRFRFVVHRWNAAALDRVLAFVDRHELPSFDLMRGVPGRTPDGTREHPLAATDFRHLLERTRSTFAAWKAAGRTPRLAGQRGEHLWWLLDWEQGRLVSKPAGRPGTHSCSVGKNLLAIRPDGTVWPCRRLPVAVGRLPEQSVAEVLASPELARFGRGRPSCRGCPVLDRCGGCWAIAQATSGDPFGPDPQCWWSGGGRTARDDAAYPSDGDAALAPERSPGSRVPLGLASRGTTEDRAPAVAPRRVRPMPQPVQVCKRCLLKSTIPYLTFDEEGLCSACTKPWRNFSDEDRARAEQKMVELFDRAKARRPAHHVLALVSGGADSCYMLDLLQRRYGLRVLAFHLAEEIGRELAESNARRIAKITGAELVRFSVAPELVKRWMREGLPLCFEHELGPHAGRDLLVHLRRALSVNFAARLGIPIVAEGVEIGQYPHRLLLQGEKKLRHWREAKKRKALLAIFRQVFGHELDGSLYDFDITHRTPDELPDHIFPNAILSYDKTMALARLGELGFHRRDLGSGYTNTEINPFVSLYSYRAYDCHVNEEHIATEIRRAGHWTISMGRRQLDRTSAIELLAEMKQATLWFAYGPDELPDTLEAYGGRFARMREIVGHDPAFLALMNAMRKVRYFADYYGMPLPPAGELGYEPDAPR